MSDQPSPLTPSVGFVVLTSVVQIVFRVRKEQIAAYGDAPVGYNGNSWIQLIGTTQREYVLETVDYLDSVIS